MENFIEHEPIKPLDTSEHATIDEAINNLDPSLVFRYMSTNVDSNILYKMADKVKKREVEESLIDVYQVAFNYLHPIDYTKNYTVILIIVDNEIVNPKSLINYPICKNAKVANGDLCLSSITLPLIDKFIVSYPIQLDNYSVTISVNKMRSKPLSFLS